MYEGTMGEQKIYGQNQKQQSMFQDRKKGAAFATGDRPSLHYIPEPK